MRTRSDVPTTKPASVSKITECASPAVDAALVTEMQAALPPADDLVRLGEMFGLLADAGRLRLLSSLLHIGECCVCDLAAASGMSESAVSHALRLLRAHRVVAVRRAGRRAYYRLQDGHVRVLLQTGLQHLSEHGEHSVPPAARATGGTP